MTGHEVNDPNLEASGNPKSSNLERINSFFRYNPDYVLAGQRPFMRRVNDYGTRDVRFYVAPRIPEFSLRKLDVIHARLKEGINIDGSTSQATQQGSVDIMFAFIRAEDRLAHVVKRTIVTELEEGAAREVGLPIGESDTTETISRFSWVILYPHKDLAEIARYVAENPDTNAEHYLKHLRYGIEPKQLEYFKRLSSKGLNHYQIKDALVAKGLEADINDLARKNQKDIKIGTKITLDF